MTMNYCGRCGSANGATARFCRQCGTELGSQAAFSSQSVPLNVEFSAKAAMKEKPKENTPPPEFNPAPAETSPAVEKAPPSAADDKPRLFTPPPPPTPPPLPAVSKASTKTEKAGDSPDVKSISASLRRVRSQSGQLIIEAARQKKDQMNEIIAEAVESMHGGTEELVPPSAPEKAGERQTSPLRPPAAAETKPPVLLPSGGQQSKAQSVAQTAANIVASATQSAARRTSDALASVVAAASSGSSNAPVMRGTTGSLAGGAQYPPHGPSSVLVQASGLKPQSFESKFFAGIIVLAILLAAGTYFIFRDNLLNGPNPADFERNLVRAEEESDRFIKLGERDREQGNYDAAVEQFHRSLELTPNNQSARFQLARTYLAAGQQDEAMKEYQALLRIAPEHLEARLQVAEIHRVRGNWNAAYQEYQRLIALDQNSGQAQFALELIERRQAEQPGSPNSGDGKTAENLRNPRDRRLQKKSAPTLPSANPRAQAPMFSQRTTPVPNIGPPSTLTRPPTEEAPDPRALADSHKKLGVRYLNVREYRAALNEFLSALQLTPGDKDLYYLVGSSYNGLNQPALAYDYYRRVDSGPYVGPAQSGARLTEKAAREDFKRREQMKGDARSGRPVANSLDE
ncbi:MAG: tetratricopeptide repeat protein [Blastocatellia bacterium]